MDNDGYDAVQIGYDKLKENDITKPLSGHFNKHSVGSQNTSEFQSVPNFNYKPGQVFDVSLFSEGFCKYIRLFKR